MESIVRSLISKRIEKGTHKTLLLFGAYSRSRYKGLNPMALAVANDILNDGKGQLLSKECRFSFLALSIYVLKYFDQIIL